MADVRSGRVIDSALVKKGFQRSLDGDHVRYRFYASGSSDPVARTKISHGMSGHSIGNRLLSLMARQLHLTKKQFLDLIDCPLVEEGYRAILREAGNDV